MFLLLSKQGTGIDSAPLASVWAGAAAGPAPPLVTLARWGVSVGQTGH